MRRIVRILLLSCIIWIILPIRISSLRNLLFNSLITRFERTIFIPQAVAINFTDLKRISHKIETVKVILSKEKNQRRLF